MRILLSALASALVVTACSAEPGDAPAAAASTAAAANDISKAVASESAPAGVARKVEEEKALYSLEYSYPPEVGAIPQLKAKLDADIDRQRRELIDNAEQQLAESKKNDFPFNPLGYWAAWKVITDLPGWLSLSGEISTYEGGAHPNHGFDTILWDRQANLRRTPTDLFASKQALSQAIRRDFCREIDRQRAKKRGEPVKSGSDEPFSDCIDPVESTLILGSSNRKAFDRIGVLVAPYEAGPYAEGEYEVTLPVTEAVLAAVKPEYRASFAVKR